MFPLLLLLLQDSASPPPQFRDEIIVSATRTNRRLSETATSAVVLGDAELRATAAPTLDDTLRQVPGFTLFRRSGSRTANPTSQGVSLRGIGASGASRVVVLDDGIPLNDPFGGWIYWSRVPRVAVNRVEVSRGGASELYGSGALSGVIQLIRRTERSSELEVDASFGTEETFQGALFTTMALADWMLSLTGELFRTEGSIVVRPADRGPVDQPANSRHSVADLTISRDLWQGSRVFLRGSLFEEARANGTLLQTNDTSTRQLSAGFDHFIGGLTLNLRAFATDQEYHQTFSAVSIDRRSERLTRRQFVPAESLGFSAQAAGGIGDHALVGGVETRRIEGTSDEDIIGAVTTRSIARGTQELAGVFVEDIFEPHQRVTITAALRYDSWQNLDASRNGTPLPARDEDAWSPRLTALWKATERLSLTASAYRSFRAPTLNELYRSFRVGNVLTLGNDELRAERLTGVDLGAILLTSKLSARATLFRNEIDRNIANVTVSVSPDLITRQRQNLGETRADGLEIDVQSELSRRIYLSGGYLLVDSEVRRFPASPQLEGLRVPQVPRHQATAQIRLTGPRSVTGALQARWVGDQFEDDQNRLELSGYTAVDGQVLWPLNNAVTAFAAVENLFDQQYEVGRTPVVTIGPPRSFRIGLQYRPLLTPPAPSAGGR